MKCYIYHLKIYVLLDCGSRIDYLVIGLPFPLTNLIILISFVRVIKASLIFKLVTGIWKLISGLLILNIQLNYPALLFNGNFYFLFFLSFCFLIYLISVLGFRVYLLCYLRISIRLTDIPLFVKVLIFSASM